MTEQELLFIKLEAADFPGFKYVSSDSRTLQMFPFLRVQQTSSSAQLRV